jgi:site-specific recombinase XerD
MSDVRFAEAEELYRLYCRARGLSPRTLDTYFSSLAYLRTFLAVDGVGAEIPSSQHLRAYIASMLERGLSRGTVQVRMRAVRAFCNFLVREGLVDASPFRGVQIPRVPDRFPNVLGVDEVARLVAASKGTTWTGVRNHALILAFLDTGMRLGELIRLDVEDVNLGTCVIRIRSGKGGKERHVFMGRTLHRALRRWLGLRGLAGLRDPFFATHQGSRLKKRNVERVVERIAKKAGLGDRRVTPHQLRHSFATHYIMNGGDPFSLQRILGHSDIKTTVVYVHMAGAGLREAHAKASPVDRLLRDG